MRGSRSPINIPQNDYGNIYTGKRTEWSSIQSVIIRVITKSRESDFVTHEYDYRPTSEDTKSTYQLIMKITIFEKCKKTIFLIK